MAIKLLENAGIGNTGVGATALNNLITGNKSGIVGKYLNECAFTATGNTIIIDKGLLIICGRQVELDAIESVTLSSLPSEDVRYQIVIELIREESGEATASIFARQPSILIQENLLKDGFVYQFELGRVTHKTTGQVTEVLRTADILTAGGGDGADFEEVETLLKNRLSSLETKQGADDITAVASNISKAILSLNKNIDSLQLGIVPRVLRGIVEANTYGGALTPELIALLNAKVLEMTGRGTPNNTDAVQIIDNGEPDNNIMYTYYYWTYGAGTSEFDGWYLAYSALSQFIENEPSYTLNFTAMLWELGEDNLYHTIRTAEQHEIGTDNTINVDLLKLVDGNYEPISTFTVSSTGTVDVYTDEVFEGTLCIRTGKAYRVPTLNIVQNQVIGLEEDLTEIRENAKAVDKIIKKIKTNAKVSFDENRFLTKTWTGLTSFNGGGIWTDGINIYYSNETVQYVLNVSTSTWSVKTWTGLTSFNGGGIWTDGINIYYSYGGTNYQYELDVSTSTWSVKTWIGLTSFNGGEIWTDGVNIYYSYGGTNQYELDVSNSTWSIKNWTGLTSFYGSNIWTDGINIYYSLGETNQYVLNVSTSTWSVKTWTGLTELSGNKIWTDGTNIYWSSVSSQYVLDFATNTWSAKTWTGLTSFYGNDIWTDGTNIYRSNLSSQYVLTNRLSINMKN